MITECYDCVFANEYLAWWWYPSIKPHLQVRTPNAHKTQMQRLQTNREEKQMRYKQINEHYVLDTYTGKKLNQKDTITLLNNYEETIQTQRREWICQHY